MHRHGHYSLDADAHGAGGEGARGCGKLRSCRGIFEEEFALAHYEDGRFVCTEWGGAGFESLGRGQCGQVGGGGE